ncbi:ATP-binding protein [Halomonas sp. E14]|uniref:ATP-binding protein n=1 Tax=Halomonas sp. E14 TaxID=3397245 RepID=UPI00403E55ED
MTLWILSLPLLVLTLAAAVALYLDTDWRKSALRDRVVTAVELQSPAMAYALSQQDEAQLDGMAHRLLTIDETRGIGIYTQSGMTLLELGRARAQLANEPPQQIVLDTRGDLWRLFVPLELLDQLPLTDPAWLEIDIDTRPLTLAHYRRLATAGLGLLLIGLLLFVFASSLGRRLDSSLRRATEALQRLRSGDLPARLPEEGAPELHHLAWHINALGDELEQSQEDMQRQIEQTTTELQESMETIEIKNIELDLAHRRALEANRVKSEFLASMSHEIRTPLNGIIGFCRLLGRSRLEPRQREWLDQVQVACDNLLALVNDVLDFSRIEAGRLELNRSELDMVTLVDEALGLQAPLAHQKGLQLVGLVYDDVPPLLRGDPLRIRQVLTNLVHNALKFTDRGEVVVRVMVDEPAGAGRALLRVSISDTGIGLTPQEQHDLFQAFRQASSGHTRQYGGSGLGLAISRQLVEQMGGRITVESEPTVGSTFSFTLPLDVIIASEPPQAPIFEGERVALYEPHAVTRHVLCHLLEGWGANVVELARPLLPGMPPTLWVAALPVGLSDEVLDEWRERLASCPCPVLLLVNATPLDIPDLRLPNGGEILCKPVPRQVLAEALRRCRTPQQALPHPPASIRVMVVDDNASNRRLLRELLRRPGMVVEEAASGEEALALAERQPFDMVLMDIRMPGMDGVETTQALRRLSPAWQHCPVVAITAHALESDRAMFLKSGLQEVLIKPVDSNELEGILQRHLQLAKPPPSISLTQEEEDEQTQESSELAVVDLALGTRLANGNAGLARELIGELIGTLPATAAELRAALSSHDEEALLDAVHALNGACRYCGAPELGLVAETLETRLRSRGMAGMETLIDDLFRAMDRLKDWQANHPTQLSSSTMASASSASSLNDK